ncbi:MAG TPA: hypothetical protein VGE96_00915 [Steroidobacteraceae bacterium]|jgi:hypothetical protein
MKPLRSPAGTLHRRWTYRQARIAIQDDFGRAPYRLRVEPPGRNPDGTLQWGRREWARIAR